MQLINTIETMVIIKGQTFASHWEKNDCRDQMLSVLMKLILVEINIADFNKTIDVARAFSLLTLAFFPFICK